MDEQDVTLWIHWANKGSSAAGWSGCGRAANPTLNLVAAGPKHHPGARVFISDATAALTNDCLHKSSPDLGLIELYELWPKFTQHV